MRQSGILLHITSLPGPEGIGTLGQEARMFVDFLQASGIAIWQVLPISPTGYGESPYQSFSSFAGNPLLIDLRTLQSEGLLQPQTPPDFGAAERVDYPQVIAWKTRRLQEAYRQSAAQLQPAMDAFVQQHAD
ncbi:MAG: 4-alpha-glucanotransferase, partial [Clostridiales bacterium]|nr:4-alpha-glucanotransferase [Clostridiales bacterium]